MMKDVEKISDHNSWCYQYFKLESIFTRDAKNEITKILLNGMVKANTNGSISDVAKLQQIEIEKGWCLCCEKMKLIWDKYNIPIIRASGFNEGELKQYIETAFYLEFYNDSTIKSENKGIIESIFYEQLSSILDVLVPIWFASLKTMYMRFGKMVQSKDSTKSSQNTKQ